MADRKDKRSSPRGGGGGGALPFADFSLFREMIREEREAARAEREAAAAEARVERETAAAEQRRLMVEIFELKLQLGEEKRRSGVAGGEPWTAGSRGEPRGPTENDVQSGTAAGGPTSDIIDMENSSSLKGHTETSSPAPSQQQQQASVFLAAMSGDLLCFVLSNLHPRDGLKVLYLCEPMRALVRQGLWEWWALALWPERTVVPSVPRLYGDFAVLVRDGNRRGLMLTVRWPEVGNDQSVSFYMHNEPSYFYACRVLAIEYDRHEQFLLVHFDVRGEGDLVQPCCARLLLDLKTPAMSPGVPGFPPQHNLESRGASPIPHRVCRLDPRREAYVAVPMPSAAGVATLAPYPPAIGPWTLGSNPEIAWSRSASGKRCTGHVTFGMKEFEESLRERRSPAAHGVPLQLKFFYSIIPSYSPVTLAEWLAEEHVSIATALIKHSCHGGKIGMHAPGELSGIVNLSKEEDTIEYAKERFRFAPDEVKSRPRWWA